MITLLLSSLAFAGELSPRWEPGQVVHYQATVQAKFPSGMTFIGLKNVEARADMVGVALDLACSPEAKKKGWTVSCAVEKADIQGSAFPGEQEALDRALDENEALLASATIKMEIAEDGRIQVVDLRGFEQSDERGGYVKEILRQLCRRAVAPLDLQMPKDGVSPGKPWKQKGTPLAAELLPSTAPIWSGQGSGPSPASGGVAGGLSLENSVQGRDGAMVDIVTTGKGNVAALVTDYSTYFANLVIAGEGRFDTEKGQIAYRVLDANARDVGSNASSTPADGYVYTAVVARVNADGSVEGPRQ